MKERKCSIDGCGGKRDARGWCKTHYNRWKRHGDPLSGRTPDGEPLKFLQDIVDNPREGCVIWPYTTGWNGYGQIRFEERNQNAHRVALILATGEDPQHLEACHTCRNRDCVNPVCLSWGAKSQNLGEDRLRDGTDNRGEKHGKAKLTEYQVMEIYNDPRTHREIAEEYGISQGTVAAIKTGKNWGWLTGKKYEKTKEKESLCIV